MDEGSFNHKRRSRRSVLLAASIDQRLATKETGGRYVLYNIGAEQRLVLRRQIAPDPLYNSHIGKIDVGKLQRADVSGARR